MPKSLDSYKDKAKARAYRNRHRLKNYKQTTHAPARYERWSRLDKFLVGSFKGTDRELSFRIKRSVPSIQVMRSRIKKGEA